MEANTKSRYINEQNISKVGARTALKSFTCNCLDLDVTQFMKDNNYLDLHVTQFIKDNKRIKTLRKLKDKCLILKPDKRQGIVLINRDDYKNSLENLLNDTSKFQLLDYNPTIRNFSTLRSHLNTLYNSQEITLEDKNAMRQKFAHVGWANRLPKMHKIAIIFNHFAR